MIHRHRPVFAIQNLSFHCLWINIEWEGISGGKNTTFFPESRFFCIYLAPFIQGAQDTLAFTVASLCYLWVGKVSKIIISAFL